MLEIFHAKDVVRAIIKIMDSKLNEDFIIARENLDL